MGNSSSLVDDYVVVLKYLLCSLGVKMKEHVLRDLLVQVTKHCYWFVPAKRNQLNLKVWREVGKALHRAHQAV